MSPSRGKKKNYDEKDVLAAVAAVKNGESFRKAAAKYDVPTAKTTVRDKFHGKYKEGKHVPGPNSVLTPDQEKSLSKHLLHMANISYGPAFARKISPGSLKYKIKKIITKTQRVYHSRFGSFKEYIIQDSGHLRN